MFFTTPGIGPGSGSGGVSPDAIVVSEDEDIRGPMREKSNAYNAAKLVYCRFKPGRILDSQTVDVENLVAIVSDEAFAQARLAAEIV